MQQDTHSSQRLINAAAHIMNGGQTQPEILTEASAGKYGKDLKIQKIMDAIQELEPGEDYSDFLNALGEWTTTAYGDLTKMQGKDNPLGSKQNLKSWKHMARAFDILGDLEWGEDEEEEPAEEPVEGEDEEQQEEAFTPGVDYEEDPEFEEEEEDTDVEWVEKNYNVLDDNRTSEDGNYIIEVDDALYKVIFNDYASVEAVKRYDHAATQRGATEILRAIQHRTVAEDTTAAAVAINPAPLGKMVRRKKR